MATITYNIDGTSTEIKAKTGESLLQIGLEAGLMIESSCGGNGFCTTCKCKVVKGSEFLSPINDNEENMGLDEPNRLSCQATIESEGDVVIQIEE